MQTEPFLNQFDATTVDSVFQNVAGSDVDENAVQATMLSLALLYLVLTGEFPQTLNIVSAEAINYYAERSDLKGTFDAVVANPPFVPLDRQGAEMRERVSDYMGQDASGRIDMYLPFLKIALELLKPGGHGLFVLPHSFMLKRSASGMRRLLSEFASIRLV
jgi:methylase of polypeptide subunit release factors